jgi:hypothetical protein
MTRCKGSGWGGSAEISLGLVWVAAKAVGGAGGVTHCKRNQFGLEWLRVQRVEVIYKGTADWPSFLSSQKKTHIKREAEDTLLQPIAEVALQDCEYI